MAISVCLTRPASDPGATDEDSAERHRCWDAQSLRTHDVRGWTGCPHSRTRDHRRQLRGPKHPRLSPPRSHLPDIPSDSPALHRTLGITCERRSISPCGGRQVHALVRRASFDVSWSARADGATAIAGAVPKRFASDTVAAARMARQATGAGTPRPFAPSIPGSGLQTNGPRTPGRSRCGSAANAPDTRDPLMATPSPPTL